MKVLLISFYILLFLYRKLIWQSHAALRMERIWSDSILENVNTIRGLSKNILSRDSQRFLANDTLYITQKLLELTKSSESKELENTFEFYRRNKEDCQQTNIESSFPQDEKEKMRIELGRLGCFVSKELRPIFNEVDKVYTLSFEDAIALNEAACTTEFDVQFRLILRKKFDNFYKALSFTEERVHQMLLPLGFNSNQSQSNQSFLKDNKEFVDHMTEQQIASIVPKLDCEEIIKERLKNMEENFELSVMDDINGTEADSSIENFLSSESKIVINSTEKNLEKEILTQISEEIATTLAIPDLITSTTMSPISTFTQFTEVEISNSTMATTTTQEIQPTTTSITTLLSKTTTIFLPETTTMLQHKINETTTPFTTPSQGTTTNATKAYEEHTTSDLMASTTQSITETSSYSGDMSDTQILESATQVPHLSEKELIETLMELKTDHSGSLSSEVLKLCTEPSISRITKKKPVLAKICMKVIHKAILDRKGDLDELAEAIDSIKRNEVSDISSTTPTVPETTQQLSDTTTVATTIDSQFSTTTIIIPDFSTTMAVTPTTTLLSTISPSTTTSKVQTTISHPNQNKEKKFVKMKYCFDKNNRQIAQLLRILRQCGEDEEVCCIIAKIKIDSTSLKDPESKLAGLREILLQLIREKGVH